MTLQEAIKSGKPFKRPCHMYWMLVNNDRIVYVSAVGAINWTPNIEDYFADDYFVKEDWYEGDFKKKFPNGVLCWVWDRGFRKRMAIVIGYDKERVHPFLVTYGAYYEYAEPIKPEEAPAIIGGQEDENL